MAYAIEIARSVVAQLEALSGAERVAIDTKVRNIVRIGGQEIKL